MERARWSTATRIRTIFRDACSRAGQPYFNPHSFRNTLVRFGESICKTREEFKAWSQNLGHEKVLTTFLSYGNVGASPQGEIIRELGEAKTEASQDVSALAKALFREMQHALIIGNPV